MDSLNASGEERRRALAFEDILLFRIASVSMPGETITSCVGDRQIKTLHRFTVCPE